MIELWVDEPSGKSGFLGLFAFVEIGDAGIYLFNPTSDDPDAPNPDVDIELNFTDDGVFVTAYKEAWLNGQTFSRMTLLPHTED